MKITVKNTRKVTSQPKGGRHVMSTDPRIKQIKDKFKEAAQCGKITLLREYPNGVFIGNCLRSTGDGCFDHLGYLELTLEIS